MWLIDYVSWCETKTCAPSAYHEAVGLALLGTMTQRKLSLRFSWGWVYPNLWIMLLGLSGVAKKSTAIRFGYELAAIVAKDLLLPQDFSIEGLVKVLAQHPVGLYVRDEFGAFMETAKKDFAKGVKDTLNGLYDCPGYWRRVLRGESFELENIFMCAIVGTVPKRFVELLETNDLYSGFLGRWSIIWPKEMPDDDEETVRIETEEQRKEGARLAKELAEIRKAFNGDAPIEAQFNDAAYRLYKDFCRQVKAELLAHPNADELSASFARFPEMCAKAAMLYELCFSLPKDGRLIIDVDSVDAAVSWVTSVKDGTLRVCAQFLGEETEESKWRVLDIIRRQPGILYRKLLQNSHLNAGALHVILEELEHENLINSEPEGKTTAFYPTTLAR